MRIVSLCVAAALTVALAGPALADTVKVTSHANFTSPSGTLQSSSNYAFQGTNTISLMVAGKTCNLNGSARGAVPTGCNYELNVTPDGMITGTLAAGNSVCTQTAQIAASCN